MSTTKHGKAPAVVHIATGDLWAGAEVQIYNMTIELQRLGHPVNVVLFNDGLLAKRLRDQGLRVHVLDEHRLNGVRILIEIAALLRMVQAAIVHTHGLKANVLGSVATLGRRTVRSVRTVHGSAEFESTQLSIAQRVLRWLDTFVGRHLQSCVVAVSAPLGAQLCRVFGKVPVKVIQNGLLPNDVVRDRPPRQTGPPYRLAIVGRLVPVKRVDIFLDICNKLLQREPDLVEGYVIGDGPLRRELEAQADALGIARKIRFTGFVEDVPGLLCDVDVLLMPSDHEGLPMGLLEAMALGVPVVAHAIGGIPDALDNGRSGVLLDSQDPDLWADAVLSLCRSPDRERLSRQAMRRFEERYTAKHSAAQYSALYSMLAEPGFKSADIDCPAHGGWPDHN